jgi:hypothetical protein
MRYKLDRGELRAGMGFSGHGGRKHLNRDVYPQMLLWRWHTMSFSAIRVISHKETERCRCSKAIHTFLDILRGYSVICSLQFTLIVVSRSHKRFHFVPSFMPSEPYRRRLQWLYGPIMALLTGTTTSLGTIIALLSLLRMALERYKWPYISIVRKQPKVAYYS